MKKRKCAVCKEKLSTRQRLYCSPRCRLDAKLERKRTRYHSDPETRMKQLARMQARKLPKQPCQHCGAASACKHHEDYSKPLEVIWLCYDCHDKLHRRRLAIGLDTHYRFNRRGRGGDHAGDPRPTERGGARPVARHLPPHLAPRVGAG